MLLITIGGAQYPIRFAMSTWEEMEEECGLPLSSISDLDGGASVHERARIAVKLLAPMLRSGSPGLTMEDVAGILETIRPEEYGMAVLAAGQCIRDAMRMQYRNDDADDYDPVLRELDVKAAKRNGKSLTWRRVAGWGLIAGLSMTEMRTMAPGTVMDLYVIRQDYDDEQHGIRRKGQEKDELLDDVDLDEITKEESDERGD